MNEPANACSNALRGIQLLVMSELMGQEKFSDDPDVIWEVAHSAKDKHSTAAAIRLVAGIVDKLKDSDRTDPHKQADFIAEIMGAYAVYPEVFNLAYKPSDKAGGLSAEQQTKAALDIQSRGRLDMYRYSDSSHSGAEEFDKQADVIEAVTEALLVNPPSQDFLKDHNLGQYTYLGSRAKGYEYRVTAQDVLALVSSAEFFKNRHQAVTNDFGHMTEMYAESWDDSDRNSSKLQFIVNILDRVSSYMPDPKHTKEFEDRVLAAKNSEDTTIGDLMQLYKDGTAKALELLTQAEAGNRKLFGDIISGAASTYATTAPAGSDSSVS